MLLVVAGAVTFIVLAERHGGSSLASTASPRAVVIELAMPAGDEELPNASMSFLDVEHHMATEHAKGNWFTPSMFTFAGVGQTFDNVLPVGAEIDVIGDARGADVEVRRQGIDELGPPVSLKLSGGVGHLPTQPGEYFLVVIGYWSQGQATFSIDITIGTG